MDFSSNWRIFLSTCNVQRVNQTVSGPEDQHHNIDNTLLREQIIEERHRPSKIELISALQRLREQPKSRSSAEESTTTKSMEVSTMSESDVPGQTKSFVEYVVPQVEYIVSHAEYVNKYDEEEFRIKPTVEYVTPYVEYVEPDIEYLSSTETSNVSTKFPDDDEREKEFPNDDEYFPVDDEYITIDQEHFWQVQDEEKFLPKVIIDPSRRTGSRSKSKRIHRRNPEKGIPEVDYPTLEILPVVHFPCENYPAPGYYADIASRCQVSYNDA